MTASQGYDCEFIDSICEDFLCKKCNLVARRLVVSSCCGESFCQTCIADTQEQGQPCPECGENTFTTFKQIKIQKKIHGLLVYCSMKERGCVWSGTLDQLDIHLDPHLDNCQYVDTKCPLNCLQTIPKNKVDQHVAQECTKRPHVCQHCGFKATYEEVVDTHLPECKYVALQCPNMCGVSCEREVMEDHMKICRLEEVECEFSSVGCDGRFIREDEDEHARQNSQKHLTLTASLAVETKEQLQHKLLEQDKKHKEEEEKLRKVVKDQEKKLLEQKKRLTQHQGELLQQEMKMVEQERRSGQQLKSIEEKLALQEQKFLKKIENLHSKLQVLHGLVEKSDKKLNMVFSTVYYNRNFEMAPFSWEKAKDQPDSWRSPAMYTHMSGYAFSIGVDANGYGDGRGLSVYTDVYSIPGKFDDQLKWPVRAQFTLELINQQGGENAKCTSEETVLQRLHPNNCRGSRIGRFHRIAIGDHFAFIEHSELDKFLNKDTLYFCVSVEMM